MSYHNGISLSSTTKLSVWNEPHRDSDELSDNKVAQINEIIIDVKPFKDNNSFICPRHDIYTPLFTESGLWIVIH